MSLLTIVQQAMVLCNLPQPTSAFGNPDATVQQFVAFAQDIGDEVVDRFFWKNLNTGGSYTGDGATTLWPLPSDYSQLSPGFVLVSSLYPLLPLRGPILNEELALMKALPTQPLRPVWRPIGSTLEIWPALATGEIATYNYYSVNWILQRGTTPGTLWVSDTDVPRFSELILRRGCVWRWKQSKGIDYAEDFRSYELTVDRSASRDDTDRMVSMSNTAVISEHWWPGYISDNSNVPP